MANWLSDDEITNMGCELISTEFKNRIYERVIFFHEKFDKENKIKLADKLVNVVESIRNNMDNRIVHYKEPKKYSSLEEEILDKFNKKDNWKRKHITDYVPETKTNEQINELRETFKIPILVLINHRVSGEGVRSDINRNEIDRILKEVIRAQLTINANESVISADNNNAKNDNIEFKIETLSDLLGDQTNLYVDILKKVLEKEKMSPIGSDGKWKKRRGDLSIIIAWMESMRTNGKLSYQSVSDEKKSKLLNSFFSEKLFTNTSIWRKDTDAYYYFKEKFDKEFK
jgi:hypothetical protein